MRSEDLRALGSKTAKDGFRNEQAVVDKFNNWARDKDAQQWLKIMGYPVKDIERVTAVRLHGYKADVQVQVTVYMKDAIGVENLSVKLVSNSQGFNQIDKRGVDKYVEMWNIPPDVANSLKLYTGAIRPTRTGLMDSRRMYLHEMTPQQRQGIVDFFTENKVLVVSDIIKGTGPFSASWMLVILTTEKGDSWALKSINHAMNIFAHGTVAANKNGNLYIGRILMQRKGGDAGRSTATMLQFKINPVALFTSDTMHLFGD